MPVAPTRFLVGVAFAAIAFPALSGSQPAQPAGHPAVAAPERVSALQGTVLEVLAAAPYTYLRIKVPQGEVWAAVPAAQVKVGSAVTVQVSVQMAKFESPSLKRTFDPLYLGTLGGAAVAAPAAAPAAMPAHGAQPMPAVGKVPKATGADAYTIAELYAKKDSLKGRKVAVRAKVLKVHEGIMGKTWIHLGDGSGQARTRDFDLTITAKGKGIAKVGDVVTAKGLLGVNRDLGSGYVYPVMIEDAALVR